MKFYLHRNRSLDILLSCLEQPNDPLFSDEFIDWARAQRHPIYYTSIYRATRTVNPGELIKVEVPHAKNSDYCWAATYHDAISISDKETALLFKMTWL